MLVRGVGVSLMELIYHKPGRLSSVRAAACRADDSASGSVAGPRGPPANACASGGPLAATADVADPDAARCRCSLFKSILPRVLSASDRSERVWQGNRRMSNDYERKVQTSGTLIEVAMIWLVLARRRRRAAAY